MTVSQFLAIVLARRKPILVAVVACTAATLALSIVIPKRYLASSVVLVEPKGVDSVMAESPSYSPLDPNYLATQAEIVSSQRVVKRVISDLQLDENSDLAKRASAQGLDRDAITQILIKDLTDHLDVKPSHDGNLLTISYKASSPQFAADASNAFAHAFIRVVGEIRASTATDYAKFFDARIVDAKAKLEQAKSVLSGFQREHGIVAADERNDFEPARLVDLEGQLSAIRGARTDASSKVGAASGRLDASPDVLQSPVIVSIKQDLARAEAKLEELGHQLGSNHPQYQQARAERDSLKERLDLEIRRVAESMHVARDVAAQREAETSKQLEIQKNRMLSMKSLHDQASVLLREVESAQRNFDAVAERQARFNLESKAYLGNMSIVAEAMPPISAAGPPWVVNVLAAMVLGLLLGVGYALGREMLDRRVRSFDDVSQFVAAPVLATLPPPSKPSQAR